MYWSLFPLPWRDIAGVVQDSTLLGQTSSILARRRYVVIGIVFFKTLWWLERPNPILVKL